MLPRFEQFIRERQYIQNVTPATVTWYRNSLKWLASENPSQQELTDAVLQMREKGRRASGCNCTLRAINSYLRWSGSELKVPRLKEPQLILPTFTDEQVKRIVAWKTKRKCQKRLYALITFLLDTGCRITEALTLRVGEIDMDNLLATLDGKGRKQRIVPISFALRKTLFRHCRETNRKPDSLLFATRAETRLAHRNVLRDVKVVCHNLGFNPPARTLHAFRHTFAVNYLRRGGSVFHLQKVLGHSTLEMTRRYANLRTADLQAIHEQVSLLAVKC
jgi:integrase/recombinase XerD